MSAHLNWLEFAGAFFLGICVALAFVWTVTRDDDLDDDDLDDEFFEGKRWEQRT